MDLIAQRGLITWQVGRELVDLDHDHRRKAERDAHCQANCAEHRYRPRQLHALERPHEGRQDKTQEDGECDRDEDFTREIERGDDKCADQQV